MYRIEPLYLNNNFALIYKFTWKSSSEYLYTITAFFFLETYVFFQ